METLIKPIAIVLGKFLDIIFTGMDNIGIGNIGIAIVIFTIIVKLAMMPLTFSQQKTVKVTQIMQPEIKAIRAKYKGRTDSEAQQMQNREIREVYSKYGASQTGGCIQILIQLPILFALYNVFRNLPLYLTRLNTRLGEVLSSINTQGDYLDKMSENFGQFTWNSHNDAISGLNSFTASGWDRLKELFPSSADVINENSYRILNMNNIFGIHTSIAPSQVWGLAVLIPILAGVTQFISARLGQNVQGDDRAAKIQAWMMSALMPIISVVFAFRVPAGLGLYWITTAVVQSIMQILINRHYKNMTPEQIIAKAEEKRIRKEEKKAAKRGSVDQDTLIGSASIKTKNIGSDGVKSYSNTSIKDRATLSRGSAQSEPNAKVKYKGKNLKQPFAPQQQEEQPKKRKLFGRSKSDDSANVTTKAKNVKTDVKDKVSAESKKKAKEVKEVSKDISKEVKEKAKPKTKSETKSEGKKSLAEMAGKVKEFNEKSSSSKGSKRKK